MAMSTQSNRINNIDTPTRRARETCATLNNCAAWTMAPHVVIDLFEPHDSWQLLKPNVSALHARIILVVTAMHCRSEITPTGLFSNVLIIDDENNYYMVARTS